MSTLASAMRIDDLLISIAYFSIPLQLVASLYQYPRLASMPTKLVILCILFALFIFLCGGGHLLRCLNLTHTTAFSVLNILTCIISVVTALYLLPLVPVIMSELDKSLEELKHLNEETETSKRKLFTFMNFLCHEIRNPLFAITSNIEFAQDLDMTNELSESLLSINQSANLMLRLVNDVLDLSKIESGKLELEEHEFELREFFQNLASTMGRQIKTRCQGRVEFVFNMSHNVPKYVVSDSVRLLQVAYNILSNACKFTEEGTITCGISLTNPKQTRDKKHNTRRPSLKTSSMASEGDDDESSLSLLAITENSKGGDFSMACLDSAERGLSTPTSDDYDIKILKMTFEDTGSGIEAEHLERIFQPYSQSKLSDFRKHGGTGLGLSIISKLLDMMGGKVKVSSVVNVGSKFVVVVPIKVPKEQRPKRRDSFAKLKDVDDLLVATADTVPPTVEATLVNDIEAEDRPTDSNNAESLFPAALVGCPSSFQTANPPPLPVPSPLFQTTSSHDQSNASMPQETIPPSAQTETPKPVPLFQSPPSDTSLAHQAPATDQTGALFQMAPAPTQASSGAATNPTITADRTLKRPASKTKIPEAQSNKTQLPKFNFPTNTNLILVVDDNAVNRKLLGRMLKFFNADYQTAENGLEAVQIMEKSRNMTGDETAPHFGLIFMDLSMPVMDGYEAIERLRGMGKGLKWLPIVALTANALAEEKRRALEAGATEFNTKPILRNVVHATIALHVGPPNKE